MSDTAKASMDAPDQTFDAPNDVRPLVSTGSGGNWALYGFIILLAIGGVLLFNALSASREAEQGSGIAQQQDDQQIASPQPLIVPDTYGLGEPLSPEARGLNRVSDAGLSLENQGQQAPVRLARTTTDPREIPPPPRGRTIDLPSPPMPQPPVSQPLLENVPTSSRVVYENVPRQVTGEEILAATQSGVDRVKATRLENPTMTIPQGTVIPAVLETAIDSTRGGGVRALVQRNVMGFDGKRILIPRGSRLYGEYQADLKRGQNRALVQWTRLIRPDGVTIALNSPSSDPLGRAGVKGKVDSKFFQRFGNALLQSVLDIGVGLAVNSASDGVIVALPGSTQNVQVTDGQQILPTLKVRQGTSVSVFVARDLDFSSVES